MSEPSHSSSSCALPHTSDLSKDQPPKDNVAGLITQPQASMSRSQSDSGSASQPPVASLSASIATLPTAVQRRRARELATVLLSLATCQGCSRPLQDPVSLPCGHSACLQCIKDRVMPANSSSEVSLPCHSHLPPRLPLSPMTVPCPVHGCPRSAIGRGIGVWAGHMPRYGLNISAAEQLPLGSQDVGPGSLPLDGFVVGVPEHPQQLTVIAPQARSKAHLFAAPVVGTGDAAELSESLLPSLASSNLLRTDVTLTKAVAILKRYAASPPKPTRHRNKPSQPARAHRRGRSRALARLRGNLARARGSTRAGEPPSVHARTVPRSRLSASQPGNGNFGMNESDLESGTVGGVSAVISDSEDDDSCLDDNLDADEEAVDDDTFYHGSSSLWANAVPSDDDEAEEEDEDEHLWPDRVGGAYSRPLTGPYLSAQARRSKDKSKRRRSKPIDELHSDPSRLATSRSADAKVAKREPVRALQSLSHIESGWSTEDSAVDSSSSRPQTSTLGTDDLDGTDLAASNNSLSLSGKVGPRGEPLVQSVATLHSELVEVLECHLCYLLLYQPLTTPCGHTFCKPCFARSLDHGNKCPLCRSEMPNFSFFQDHAPNASLLNILTSDTATFSDEDQDSESTQAWLEGSVPKSQKKTSASDDPEVHPHHFGLKRLYEQRKAAIEQEEREARLSTPIFVCTLAFPGMPTILHIFEPRYRLMMRRCLESGNPRFGMVMPSRTNGGLEEYGTMLEIKSMQMLADGRSMIETVGSYRFKLLEKGSLDGYTVGRIERVDDVSLEEEEELEQAALRRRKELDRQDSESTTPTASTAAAHTDDQPPEPQQEARSRSRSPSAVPTGANTQDADERLSLFRNTAQTETVPTRGEAEASQEDGSLAPFPPVPAEPSTQELIEICTTFIETLRSGSAPWLLSRLNHTYGPMPSADEVERLGYWMALVMPIDEHEKAKLLPITSRRLRLRLVVHWIEQLRQSWWFNSGCTVS